MDGWMSRKNWKQKRNRWHLPGMYLLSFSCSLYTAMARRPREQRESPIFSLPWVLAPLPLSDEESGPKVLLTLEGEESLEEGVGKAAQRSQRRRRRPRLQSCRAGSLGLCVRATARHWARRQRILSVRAAWAPAVGKLAPRVATGTPEPNGGGGSKIDSTVEITPSPNGVGTLGDAVPTEQLQGEREREREREGEGHAGGDGMGSSLSLAVPPGPLSFEALLAQVGALGGGQQLQLGLCCLPVLFVALGLASDPIFTLAPPLHCHYGAFPPNASGWEQPPNASGVSVASAALAASAASRLATSTDPSCSGFAPPDFNHCLKDWDYNGLPVLTTNAIGQWDLVCDLGWQVILEQILFILGFASGYLFLGYPADRFGRRGIVLLTLGLVGPCGVGGAAAGSSTGVMALRFLLGFLLAGVDLGVYLMRLELCDPTQRLRVALAGELVGVGGHFLFLGLALVSKDWRFLQRMITAPCILFLFYGWPGLFLESARWLIVKRQIEEAQSVLRILAERNRPHGQMLGEEAQEALQDLNEAAITTFSVLGLFSSQAAGILSTLLAAEVIPTTVRGRGLGLIVALGALGGLSGPAQRLHMGHGAFLQHVVLAACALLCILSIMLLPETKRKLLPEVLRDGELCRRPSLLRQPPRNRCDHVPLLATPNPAL
ncbi:solute carrier family 22 member 17 isoform X4 [Ovis canadensis]|uniref:solute carrier family 22 member 17 isoform X4 n=1 Tax=Ovis canadensis TaxID=37174 RepID=UPI0037521E70